MESVERISDPPMNETSISSAVVPALIYLNPNQAPNAAQSKTALAVSGKYWNYNTMQFSKKIFLSNTKREDQSSAVSIINYINNYFSDKYTVLEADFPPFLHISIFRQKEPY